MKCTCFIVKCLVVLSSTFNDMSTYRLNRLLKPTCGQWIRFCYLRYNPDCLYMNISQLSTTFYIELFRHYIQGQRRRLQMAIEQWNEIQRDKVRIDLSIEPTIFRERGCKFQNGNPVTLHYCFSFSCFFITRLLTYVRNKFSYICHIL